VPLGDAPNEPARPLAEAAAEPPPTALRLDSVKKNCHKSRTDGNLD